MAGRLVPAALLLVFGAAIGGEAVAQSRLSIYPNSPKSIYPKSGGCSSLSRINPCTTRRIPAPVGNPTSGPLTESTRRGPLDRPDDPLGIDADLPMPKDIVPQTLPSQKD